MKNYNRRIREIKNILDKHMVNKNLYESVLKSALSEPSIVHFDISDILAIIQNTKNAGVKRIKVREKNKMAEFNKAVGRIENLKRVKGMVINIVMRSNMTLEKLAKIVGVIAAKLNKNVNIAWGAKENNKIKCNTVVDLIYVY